MTLVNEWFKVKRLRCDLCDKVAAYQHPEGGLRCRDCYAATVGASVVGASVEKWCGKRTTVNKPKRR